MTKAVPTKYHHKWRYSPSLWEETKLKNKKGKTYWKIKWSATKSKKSKSYGNFPKGFKGAWSIKGIQYIKKIGIGKYKTQFKGIKKPLKFRKN